MSFVIEKDYLEEARSRVTEAFKNKPVFDHYLQLLSGYSLELQAMLKSLGEERWIDTAVGAQLDILGNIVGQDRVIIGGDLIEFFGYLGALNAKSYGTIYDPSVGGYYRGRDTAVGGNLILSDEIFRIFIKAKIMKNTTRSTPEDVIRFIKFVFPEIESVWISSSAYGEADIQIFSNSLTLLEKGLITYFLAGDTFTTYFVPKTLGVKYNFNFVTATTYLGFLGAPRVGPWGDLDNPAVGGTWYSNLD